MVWEQAGEEDDGGPHLLQSSNGTVIEQVVVPMVNPPAYTYPLCDTVDDNSFSWKFSYELTNALSPSTIIPDVDIKRIPSWLSIAVIFDIKINL